MYKKYVVSDFKRDFPDDTACLEYIFLKKYPNRKCTCGKTLRRISTRKAYGCFGCGKQVYPLKGTIFERSSASLSDWFFVIYLMSQAKNGISAKEIQRHIGGSYEKCWRMAKQVRLLMKPAKGKLTGTVEADETYVGGKRRLGRRGRGTHKTPVIGVIQRNGKVRAKVVSDVSSWTIIPFITKNVRKGSRLMTDEFKSYKVKGGFGYRQESVNHSKYEYVRGKVHTNTIEGFWGGLKRALNGTYHSVGKHYLQSYVDQQAFYYDHRNQSIFHVLIERIWPYQGD